MIRVNGHIAGTVYSKSGTMIVDTTAQVDANVEVAIAIISGCVNGDIVAHEKVEVGPNAKIYGKHLDSVNRNQGWSGFRRSLSHDR